MKFRIHITILAVLILSPLIYSIAKAEELPITTTQETYHKHQGKFHCNDALYTGTHQVTYPSGTTKSIITYHENGQLNEKRHYENNRKHGQHLGWFADGSPRFILNFDHGIYHGNCQQWYSNGQKFTETNFEQSQEIGPQQAWAENGKLKANYVVRDNHRYGLIGSKLCLSTPE